ncbi:hypothetical protein B0J11DRAFT_107424 [Dendryphion nanum]|uniref:Uncharacterized protein n=1 Tax=Dendryphion nanum TaxID=256645 RepID=A0A9P9IDR9_9PLEO|nr:hypothetical protein B0J11DRAFT_107424 [Dendryphion nanum]
MLPPVDPNILQRNPSFAILYKDLYTRRLNPDGSTRDTKKQRVHDEIRRNLTHARTTLLTSQIILRTLSTLPSTSHTLPPDLYHTISITISQLHNQLSSSDLSILTNDTDLFLDNISTISTALSTQLTLLTTQICKIADPLHDLEIELLPAKAAQLKEEATILLPTDIAQARAALANTAYDVLTLHRQILTTAIQILEQTKHGSIARATKSKAELLQSRALLLSLQARVHGLTHPPPQELVVALGNFSAEQDVREEELRGRGDAAERTLGLYERAGEKGMRDVARRKEVLRGEIERIRVEIEKLERGDA